MRVVHLGARCSDERRRLRSPRRVMPSRRKMCSKTRLTVVVPAPLEPVTAMIGMLLRTSCGSRVQPLAAATNSERVAEQRPRTRSRSDRGDSARCARPRSREPRITGTRWCSASGHDVEQRLRAGDGARRRPARPATPSGRLRRAGAGGPAAPARCASRGYMKTPPRDQDAMRPRRPCRRSSAC